jgi:hypothetical protein
MPLLLADAVFLSLIEKHVTLLLFVAFPAHAGALRLTAWRQENAVDPN